MTKFSDYFDNRAKQKPKMKEIKIKFEKGNLLEVHNTSDCKVTIDLDSFRICKSANITIPEVPGRVFVYPVDGDKKTTDEPKEITSYTEAHKSLTNEQLDEIKIANDNFGFRAVIAKALGSRPFIYGAKNWYTHRNMGNWFVNWDEAWMREGVNYFETEDRAKKYLEICLKEGLL